MEGLSKGEMGEENIFEVRENKNPMEDLVKDYVFSMEKETNISLAALGQMEGQGIIHGSRSVEKEAKLCSCKKGLEEKLLRQKPEDMPRFWNGIKDEYCKNFANALGEGTKNLPRSKRKMKNKTVLDEEDGNTYSVAKQKAEKSFDEMQKGMMREIAVNRILNAILNIKAEIASSDIDIKNKIDIIAYPNKTGEVDKIIIAVQVKNDYGNDGNKAVEEVAADTKNAKKREFYEKSSDFEKELNKKDPEAKVIKIWVSVHDGDVTGEGTGYKNELKVFIESELKKILDKYRH